MRPRSRVLSTGSKGARVTIASRSALSSRRSPPPISSATLAWAASFSRVSTHERTKVPLSARSLSLAILHACGSTTFRVAGESLFSGLEFSARNSVRGSIRWCVRRVISADVSPSGSASERIPRPVVDQYSLKSSAGVARWLPAHMIHAFTVARSASGACGLTTASMTQFSRR